MIRPPIAIKVWPVQMVSPVWGGGCQIIVQSRKVKHSIQIGYVNLNALTKHRKHKDIMRP